MARSSGIVANIAEKLLLSPMAMVNQPHKLSGWKSQPSQTPIHYKCAYILLTTKKNK